MDIQTLIASADILKYISQFADLEPHPDGDFWCLSPLKSEKTPSFSVNVATQKFYDFSSGKYGNILDFIRYYHKCSFPHAVEILKQFAGVTGDIVVSKRQSTTADFMRTLLPKEKQLKPCTAKILPDNYMDRYFWSEEHLKPWADEGISYDVLYDFGVRYDLYEDAIVYPVWNTDGKILTVGIRTLNPNYKALKIPKYRYATPLGSLPVLYGYHKAIEDVRRTGRIILFEGAKSVMKLKTFQQECNACALLTSHISDAQFNLIVQTGASCVIAVDSDVIPWEDKNVQRLTRFCKVEMVLNRENILAEKESPIDHGQEVWKYLYEKRSSLN